MGPSRAGGVRPRMETSCHGANALERFSFPSNVAEFAGTRFCTGGVAVEAIRWAGSYGLAVSDTKHCSESDSTYIFRARVGRDARLRLLRGAATGVDVCAGSTDSWLPLRTLGRAGALTANGVASVEPLQTLARSRMAPHHRRSASSGIRRCGRHTPINWNGSSAACGTGLGRPQRGMEAIWWRSEAPSSGRCPATPLGRASRHAGVRPRTTTARGSVSGLRPLGGDAPAHRSVIGATEN
jgi:hypothetical protein